MTGTRPKGLIFISDVTKALEHEWFVEFTDRNEFDPEFVLFNSKQSELFQFIDSYQFKVKNYPLPSKYLIPFYIFYFSIKLLMHPRQFVHCHLFQASLIGILAAKLAGIKKRIYTRHHADFHLVYHPSAVKYDLLINKWATHIIAVSKNVRKILVEQEQVSSEKITVISHGIPLSLIDPLISTDEIRAIKNKYALNAHFPVVGVISRFVMWKGIQYIIPAFKKLLENYPKAKLVLANAGGSYETEIISLLKDLPASSYTLVKFESAIAPLFKSFDVFVHAPIDAGCEAFGQVYIEALSLGVPMVCTISGIAAELIIHEHNALVADYKNWDSIYRNLITILENPALKNSLVHNGKINVKEFTFENKFDKIRTLYLS